MKWFIALNPFPWWTQCTLAGLLEENVSLKDLLLWDYGKMIWMAQCMKSCHPGRSTLLIQEAGTHLEAGNRAQILKL